MEAQHHQLRIIINIYSDIPKKGRNYIYSLQLIFNFEHTGHLKDVIIPEIDNRSYHESVDRFRFNYIILTSGTSGNYKCI